MLVTTIRTPIPLADLPAIVNAGYAAAFPSVVQSVSCPDTTRRMVIAHWLLEHGREGHDPNRPLDGVFCFNLGNQDASQVEIQSFPTFRTVPECEGSVCGRKVQHIRRAFNTPEEGCEAYMLRMASAYEVAWGGARMGDPVTFVHGMKMRGYFTGSEVLYLRLMASLYNEAVRRW